MFSFSPFGSVTQTTPPPVIQPPPSLSNEPITNISKEMQEAYQFLLEFKNNLESGHFSVETLRQQIRDQTYRALVSLKNSPFIDHPHLILIAKSRTGQSLFDQIEHNLRSLEESRKLSIKLRGFATSCDTLISTKSIVNSNVAKNLITVLTGIDNKAQSVFNATKPQKLSPEELSKQALVYTNQRIQTLEGPLSKEFAYDPTVHSLTEEELSQARTYSIRILEIISELRAFSSLLNNDTSDHTVLHSAFQTLDPQVQSWICRLVEAACYSPNEYGFAGNYFTHHGYRSLLSFQNRETNENLLEKCIAILKANPSKGDLEKAVAQFESLRRSHSITAPTPLPTTTPPSSDTPLNIAMAAFEFDGFINVGGLAPAVAEMAKSLTQLLKERGKGEKVRVILPKFSTFFKESLKEFLIDKSKKYPIERNGKKCEVWKLLIDKNGRPIARDSAGSYKDKEITRLYLIEHDLFDTGRIGNPYSDMQGHKASNEELNNRYIAFNELASELVSKLSKKPKNPVSILHCHDAHTALISQLLIQKEPTNNPLGKVFTIHNAFTQLPFYNTTALGTPPRDMNCLIEGIIGSDAVTTVSTDYAKELLKEESLLRKKTIEAAVTNTGGFFGILNGAPRGWNPATDTTLKDLGLSYSVETTHKEFIAIHQKIRSELCDRLRTRGYNFDPQKPIIGAISRLDRNQKGTDKYDLLIQEALAAGVQIIFVGTDPNDQDIHDPLAPSINDLQLKYKDNPGVAIIVDYKDTDGKYAYQQTQQLGPLLRAAVQRFLIPSIHEPCGLTQYEAASFGVPTFASDALEETVVPLEGSVFRRKGNWYSSEQADEIRTQLRAILPAVQKDNANLYDPHLLDQKQFVAQRKYIMRLGTESRNTGWPNNAQKLVKVYAQAIAHSQSENAHRETISLKGFGSTF